MAPFNKGKEKAEKSSLITSKVNCEMVQKDGADNLTFTSASTQSLLNATESSRDVTINKPLQMGKTEFRISAAAAQGGRRYMEDRIQVIVKRDGKNKVEHIFAGVFDGHGGPQASQYVCNNLYNNIIKNDAFNSSEDTEVLKAIHSGFLKTHYNMLKVYDLWPPTHKGYPCTAGTTASCVFIRNGKLYTGHVGDSFVMLVNFAEEECGFNDSKLTVDHRPDNKKERTRILQAGGDVADEMGTVRVVWKRHKGPIRRSTTVENVPFLAVSRALGDFWSLNPAKNVYVVSPEPDVDVFQLKDTDKYIVIASDGVSGVMGTKSIVNLLKELNSRQTIINKNPSLPSANDVLNCAQFIMHASFLRWGNLKADNISAVAIELTESGDDRNKSGLLKGAEKISENDINSELSRFPTSVIRVGSNKTERVCATSPTLQYLGPSEKPRKRSNAAPDDSRKSDDAGILFEGPGFVVPQQPDPNGSSSDLDEAVLPTMPVSTLQTYFPSIFGCNPPSESINKGSGGRGRKRKSMSNAGEKPLPNKMNTSFSIDHLFGNSSSNKVLSEHNKSSSTTSLNASTAPTSRLSLYTSSNQQNTFESDNSSTSSRHSTYFVPQRQPEQSNIQPLISTTKAFGAGSFLGMFTSSPSLFGLLGGGTGTPQQQQANKIDSSSPLGKQLNQGVKRRHHEAQDEIDSNIMQVPSKKRKRPIEKIGSKRSHLFGGKKDNNHNKEEHREAGSSVLDTSIPFEESFYTAHDEPSSSNGNDGTAKKSEAGGGRSLWNFLSFLWKPFSSPKI